jgi:hypothetical protein
MPQDASGKTPKYSLKYMLPSCIVSVDLLRELERYLLQVETHSGILENSFEVKITDKVGTLMVESLADYPRRHLPRGTKSVVIGRQDSWIVGASVGFEKSYATLKVALRGQDARERALRIKDETLLLMEPSRTGITSLIVVGLR